MNFFVAEKVRSVRVSERNLGLSRIYRFRSKKPEIEFYNFRLYNQNDSVFESPAFYFTTIRLMENWKSRKQINK